MCPNDLINMQLAKFDEMIINAVDIIAGGSLTDTAEIEASLPIKMGGLGLRSAKMTADAAFISSCV